MNVTSFRTEILGVADAVAREKGIDREEVLQAMEMAIQKASRARFGFDRDIRTHIDRKTGEIQMAAYREVVEVVELEGSQISLKDAKLRNPEIQVGEFVTDELPPFDFGRVAAQTAKQVIFQKVRDAERMRQYEEFKNRMGELVSGSVKRVEFGNVMVDIGRTEAILMRDQLIPRESFRPGDRIRAYIMDVRPEARGSQIFLSRTHPQFLVKLFAQEVPEIYDGHIEIKSAARDPGSRAKMAVYCGDRSMDPVGACVGMRGSRVQAVVAELQGEKIDIIPWSENPAVFVVNAMIPAEVAKVVLDEDTGRVEVIVPDDQLSLAIGRRGQNVRLASELTNFGIDIVSESQESERRNKEVNEKSDLFVRALDVDNVIAHLLISEGFGEVEEIAMVDIDDLAVIEGFDADLAQELQNRAKLFIAEQTKERAAQIKKHKVKSDLETFVGLTFDQVIALAEKNVKSLDDFADLSGDELVECLPDLTLDRANALIMKAREHWFESENEQSSDSND